jgi:flavorubredoxin
MRAIVLYDTMFGNTEKIAISIAKGLQRAGVDSESIAIRAVSPDRLSGYDLLVVGAPTQYFTASKPMKEFLGKLEKLDLKGKAAFAFDTKLGSRLSGSAAKFIEKKLEEIGLEILKPRSSAIVVGCETGGKKERQDTGGVVLKEGMEELFESVGKELGMLLNSARKVGTA